VTLTTEVATVVVLTSERPAMTTADTWHRHVLPALLLLLPPLSASRSHHSSAQLGH